MAKEYRSRTKILVDLLTAVRDEEHAGVTRLLFLANLSHDRLKEYLDELDQRGWVSREVDGNRTLWQLTEQGRATLIELRKVQRLMADFGLGL